MSDANNLPLEADVIEAARRYGEDAADRVHAFLDSINIKADPEHPVPMPAAFLLGLAAALRLADWESRGITAHRDGGLPPARDALLNVLQSYAAPPDVSIPAAVGLDRRVGQVYFRRFAWHARPDLGAEVVLELPDEDEFLERAARFLSANRRAGTNLVTRS